MTGESLLRKQYDEMVAENAQLQATITQIRRERNLWQDRLIATQVKLEHAWIRDAGYQAVIKVDGFRVSISNADAPFVIQMLHQYGQEISESPGVAVNYPDLNSTVDFVRSRRAAIEEQGCTPLRVELGSGLYDRCGRPVFIIGLPVVVIPNIDTYARVAYEEWHLELPPIRPT